VHPPPDDPRRSGGPELPPSPWDDGDPAAEPLDEWIAPSEDAAEALTGRTISDRFLVGELLGEGAVGRVYEAVQLKLGRRVAIKVLHPHYARQPAQRARFHREARTASRLNHPGTVTIYDYGEWDGRLYIAMEYLDGPTLSSVLRDEFPLAPARVGDIMIQLIDALAAAHDADLLHRDLKPDNVVLLRGPGDAEVGVREVVKIVDFGLAFVTDESQEPRLTQDDSISGTPAYMSPEQIRGDALDARSDLYALGCILYELLANAPPFDDDNAMDVMMRHLYDEPAPPSARGGLGVHHPGLEAVAMRALAKSPEGRYSDARAMGRAVREALETAADGGTTTRPAAPDRAARAAAVGLRRATERRASVPDVPLRVAAFPSPTVGFAASATAALRAQGVTVQVEASPTEAVAEAVRGTVDAALVDLRGALDSQVDPGLRAIEEALADAPADRAPVLVIGPVEPFDRMTRALAAGVDDYLPVSDLGALTPRLRRAVRRAQRRNRRRAKPPIPSPPEPEP